MSLKRLRWRCRRGMRELDVLLEAWLDARGPALSDEELETFQRFLDTSDMDLQAWLTRRSRPDETAFAALVDDIFLVSGVRA